MIFIGFLRFSLVFDPNGVKRTANGLERTADGFQGIPTDSNDLGAPGDGDQGRGLWVFAILTAWRPHEGVGGFAMVSCDPLPSSTSEQSVFSLFFCTARAIQGIQIPSSISK